MTTPMQLAVEWLERQTGYRCRDASLVEAALTHRSVAGMNNERLEFLGDGVLNCVVADLLYRRYARADEGELSRLRARLVRGEALAAKTMSDIGNLNSAFHLALIVPHQQPVTAEVLSRLHTLSQRYVRMHLLPMGRIRRATREHNALYEAWAEGDARQAVGRDHDDCPNDSVFVILTICGDCLNDNYRYVYPLKTTGYILACPLQ